MTEFSKIEFASLPIELDKISSIQGKQQKIWCDIFLAQKGEPTWIFGLGEGWRCTEGDFYARSLWPFQEIRENLDRSESSTISP